MNNVSSFFTNLLLSAVRHIGSIAISIILIIIGAIWSKNCLYIGLALLAVNVIVALVSALRSHALINYRTDDDPEFNEMMDKLSADPNAFLSDIMNSQDERKELHGEELLTLDDDDLFETVYFQNLDIADGAENEGEELKQFTGARRLVYVLALYDEEIQNGGLCQFFVNSSRTVAPYVAEALTAVDAKAHLELFERFIADNNIDVSSLESFIIHSKRGYIKQTKRFDFDSFDNEYYELPALQDKVTAYIKANINDF